MIMRRETGDDRYSSTFTDILGAAREYWSELDHSKPNRIASGFMVAKDSRIIKAELSVNYVRKHISLIIRFKPKSRLLTSDILRVLRFQNKLTNLCSFLTADDEDNIVILKTVVPIYAQDPAASVRPLFEDTLTVLEDEQLHQIL